MSLVTELSSVEATFIFQFHMIYFCLLTELYIKYFNTEFNSVNINFVSDSDSIEFFFSTEFNSIENCFLAPSTRR
jgi:hypothetical protein